MENLSAWIQVNLDFVKSNLLTQVKQKYVQSALEAFVDRLKPTIEIIFDENPDNKAQLVELWSSFTADPKMVEALHWAIDDLTATITDPILLAGVQLVKEKLVQTLIALTDANKMNGQQIAEVWAGFFKSPEFIAFFVTNAAVLLDKLPLPAWLRSLINLFIKK